MKILINASNLGQGGATQVADSVCRSLNKFTEDKFVVVLTPTMQSTVYAIEGYDNVIVHQYQLKNTINSYLWGRDHFLEDIVARERVDVVLSIFAPTWWTPRIPHLCGFALANLVMPESPYFTTKGFMEKIKLKASNLLMGFFFWRSSDYFYSENEIISARVKKLLHCKEVYTVTNYYNQVFDNEERQKFRQLPEFAGHTFLTISNSYPHKNLQISIGVADYLSRKYPDFPFRFVFTIEESQFPPIPQAQRCHFLFIGKVDISECPSLYKQSDIAFQPTLLECFTATYPEAMRMETPIVTTDLPFARSICGNAAFYYSAVDSSSAAEALYKVCNDCLLKEKLIDEGRKQLLRFDNYCERAEKLISLAKTVYKNS